MTDFHTKRVYDPPDAADGYRVLVDRLWPRGLSKDAAHIDLWAKDSAPSTELRRWFHEDRDARMAEFRERYRAELDASGAAVQLARDLSTHDTVTLLTAATDVKSGQVPVLLDALATRPE